MERSSGNVKFIPGLVSVTFKTKSADDIVELCRNAGLETIEWSEGWHIPEDDPVEAERIGILTRDSGLSVAEYGSYYKLGKGMDFRKRIVNARALGTDTIRIWAGDRASAAVPSAERKSMVEEARRVADMADAEGMRIVLEWHRETLTDTNESGLSFIEAVDRANFLTLWQPTMALSIPERCEGLQAIGKRLVNLHVYYWDDSGRRPLSEGAEIWREYLDCVSGEHYALLEFVKDNTVEQFLSDAKTLHELIDRS